MAAARQKMVRLLKDGYHEQAKLCPNYSDCDEIEVVDGVETNRTSNVEREGVCVTPFSDGDSVTTELHRRGMLKLVSTLYFS